MKKTIALVAAALTLALCVFSFAGCSGGTSKEDGTYTIGICQLAEHPALDQATEGFKAYLTEKLGDKVVFEEQNAQGEQTNCTTIVNKFVSSGVDLIMANATNAVKAAREATSEIPIVGTSVTDYAASGLVESNDAPGANVSGATDMNPVDVHVKLMGELLPDVKTVGIVYCSAEENSKLQADEAKTAFEKAGYTVNIYTVADSNEIQTVVSKACGEVDAFYEPTDNLIASNVPTMSNVTTPAKKPVLTGEESMCKNGFLATYSVSYYDLGYKAGEMAYDILVNGKNPAEMPIFRFDSNSLTLVINEDNASELGITIPDSLKK